MIHLLAYEVRKHLKVQKFPIGVNYGPEAFEREIDTSLIVIHCEGESDSFAAPSGPGRNPKNYRNQAIGFACLVFAKASKPGSRREDHEVLCRVFTSALICALVKASGDSSNNIAIGPGHFLTVAEREGSKFARFPGVVYELKASLIQSVLDWDWNGLGREVVQLTSVSTDTFAIKPAAGEGDEPQYAGTIDVD